MCSIEDIEKEYLKQLAVPESKFLNPVVFCPVGLVGAGKTTVTKPVSEALGLVRISSDEVRKVLKDNGCSYEPLKEIIVSVATRFIKEKKGIALDMDCGNPETQEMIHRLETEYGYRAFWVHINPTEEFILHKLKGLTTNWLGSAEQMVKNYFLQKEVRSRQVMPSEYFYIFDTGRDDMQMQIEDCVRKITNALEE